MTHCPQTAHLGRQRFLMSSFSINTLDVFINTSMSIQGLKLVSSVKAAIAVGKNHYVLLMMMMADTAAAETAYAASAAATASDLGRKLMRSRQTQKTAQTSSRWQNPSQETPQNGSSIAFLSCFFLS